MLPALYERGEVSFSTELWYSNVHAGFPHKYGCKYVHDEDVNLV